MDRVQTHRTIHQSRDVLGTHRHQEAYVALVLSGGYVEAGPDGAWTCEAGDLVIHPPFHLHGDRMGTRGAKVLNFVLPFAPVPSIDVSSYAVVRLLQPDRVERIATRNAISALAEAIADGLVCSPAAPVDWCDRLALALMRRPQSLVGSLSKREGISAEHASRAFRARFGVGPATFRAELRLRRALRLLAECSDSLADIACSAGYADQSHMSRGIKSATGFSTNQVRAMVKKRLA